MKKPVNSAIVLTTLPLVDDTDFKTPETVIAYNAAGMSVSLFKETAAGVTVTPITLTSGGSNDWTHKAKGVYEIEITAAQNDTEGIIWVEGNTTGVLPWCTPRYEAVPANIYNSLVLGTDNLAVDAREISSSSTAADNLELIAANAKGSDNKILLSGDAQDLSGSLDVNAKSISTDAVSADAISSGAVTEIQNGLAQPGDEMALTAAYDAAKTAAAPGAQMDLVNAPNATAVTAIQNGIARTGADSDTLETLSGQIDAISTGGGDATLAKQEEILTAIDAIGGEAGSGADQCTLTIEDSSHTPIADADVWISTDVAGANVIAGTRQTNSAGQVSFMLDDGVAYYAWRQKDGEEFSTNPYPFTAVKD